MKLIKYIFVFFICAATSGFGTILNASAVTDRDLDIVFIVNANAAFPPTIKKQDLMKLYLGRKKTLGGMKAVPINSSNKPLFITFVEKHLGLTLSRYLGLWLKMKIKTGQKMPKKIMESSKILEYVSTNIKALAYIPAADFPKIPKGIKLIKIKK